MRIAKSTEERTGKPLVGLADADLKQAPTAIMDWQTVMETGGAVNAALSSQLGSIPSQPTTKSLERYLGFVKQIKFLCTRNLIDGLLR